MQTRRRILVVLGTVTAFAMLYITLQSTMSSTLTPTLTPAALRSAAHGHISTLQRLYMWSTHVAGDPPGPYVPPYLHKGKDTPPTGFSPFPLDDHAQKNFKGHLDDLKALEAMYQHVLDDVPAHLATRVSTAMTLARPTSKSRPDSLEEKAHEKWRQPDISLKRWIDRMPLHYTANTPGKDKKFAFATFLHPADSSLTDTAFMQTQHLIWRTLWHPRSSTKRHPFLVLVTPEVSEAQRLILAGAGAIVRDTPLLDWRTPGLSKLQLWGELDFDRITLLSLGSVPVVNIDEAFVATEDALGRQSCARDDLTWADAQKADALCPFVMVASVDPESGGNLYDVTHGHMHNQDLVPQLDTAVIVLKPETNMHKKLLRASMHTEDFGGDRGGVAAEMDFYRWMFARDSPFPARLLDKSRWGIELGLTAVSQDWNEELRQKSRHASVLRDRDPALLLGLGAGAAGARTIVEEEWEEMVTFFEGREFKSNRRAAPKWH